MAKSSDMIAQLAKKPLGVKLAILGAVMLFLGGVYYQFFLSDLNAEQKKQATRNKSLRNTTKKLRAKEVEFKKLSKRLKGLKTEIDQIKRLLPSEAELASFVQELQTKATAARVKFENYETKKEKSLGEFKKVPVKVKVRGTYYQLKHYFYLLGPKPKDSERTAPQERSGRLVTIENFSVQPVAKQDGPEFMLEANFTAATFRKEQPTKRKRKKKKKASTKKDKASKAAGAAKPGASSAPGTAKPPGNKMKSGASRLTNPGL